MARKPGASDVSEAFDMFLDTISNAFGGIIFISLLVCILLQISGKEQTVSVDDPVKQAILKNMLKNLEGEINDLLALRKTLDERLKDLPAADPELVAKYLRLSGEEQKLLEAYQAATAKLAKAKIELEELLKVIRSLIQKRDEKKGEQLALREKLKEFDRTGVTLRKPRFHTTEKVQIPLLISGGRAVFVYKHDERGTPVEFNEEDVIVTKDGAGNVVSLKARPGRGVALPASGDLPGDLVEALKKFTNNPTAQNRKAERECHYFMVAVWANSFPQCEVLRDYLIKNNYDYGLLMLKENDAVATGPGGAGGVQ